MPKICFSSLNLINSIKQDFLSWHLTEHILVVLVGILILNSLVIFPPYLFPMITCFSNSDMLHIFQNYSSFALINTRPQQIYECFSNDNVCSVNWADVLFCEIKSHTSHHRAVGVTLHCHSQWSSHFQPLCGQLFPSALLMTLESLLGKFHGYRSSSSHSSVKVLANTEPHCPGPGDRDGPSATELTSQDNLGCKVNAGNAPELLPGEKPALPSYPQDSLPGGVPQKIYIEFSAIQFVSEI